MKKTLLLAAAALSLIGLSGCIVQPAGPAYYAAPAPAYYPAAHIYVGGGYGHRW